jgi:2-oxoglutarate ferredoxin oxidoreductase subunit gamma
MERAIVLAGFGGQGLLFAGHVLAQAAIDAGLDALWIPSYGPQMRGGTASCTVVVSDERVGSPVADRYAAAVALNGPSAERFAPLVVDGGLLVVNASLVGRVADAPRLRVARVPCTELALAAGGERLSAVVGLGALATLASRQEGGLPDLTLRELRAALRRLVEEDASGLLAGDLRALSAGARAARATTRAAAGEPA